MLKNHVACCNSFITCAEIAIFVVFSCWLCYMGKFINAGMLKLLCGIGSFTFWSLVIVTIELSSHMALACDPTFIKYPKWSKYLMKWISQMIQIVFFGYSVAVLIAQLQSVGPSTQTSWIRNPLMTYLFGCFLAVIS